MDQIKTYQKDSFHKLENKKMIIIEKKVIKI